MNESFTGTKVVLSWLAALGVVWRGISLMVVGWKAPAAQTADRLLAARARKTPWLVTVSRANDGRSASEVTLEPSVSKRCIKGRKSLDDES